MAVGIAGRLQFALVVVSEDEQQKIGSEVNPLRVAIVGSGPARFYSLQALFQTEGLKVEVDMFDRLPIPYGLVRSGVAPDHPKIKKVIALYAKLAERPEFRFFGNVEFGRDLSLADLSKHYHQVVFASGSQADRVLGIPGEQLEGVYSARRFVAWYNGDPDHSHQHFDFSAAGAVVVGVGNVAADVARIAKVRAHRVILLLMVFVLQRSARTRTGPGPELLV